MRPADTARSEPGQHQICPSPPQQVVVGLEAKPESLRETPKYRASRKSVSAVIDRLPSTISLIRRGGTSIARARPFCVGPIGCDELQQQNLARGGVGNLLSGRRRFRHGRGLLRVRRSRCAVFTTPIRPRLSRILLDHNLALDLRDLLPGHDVGNEPTLQAAGDVRRLEKDGDDGGRGLGGVGDPVTPGLEP